MLKTFFKWNSRISRRIKGLFPHTRYNIFQDYTNVIKQYALSFEKEQCVILDIGGGKRCSFAEDSFRDQIFLVSMDISPEELERNTVADIKIVSDVTKDIPYPSELPKPQIICSSCVMEHLKDNAAFISLAKDTISDGGYFIAFMPNKFALYSIINQILGKKLGGAVLRFFGKKNDYTGFEAFYDRTYPSAIRELLEENSFHIIEQRISWFSSEYFDFFFPLYFLSCIYESIVALLHIKTLCSYFIIVAKKAA